MRDALLKPTILSVSLLTIIGVGGSVPGPGSDPGGISGRQPTTVKLILTLPSLDDHPVSLLSGMAQHEADEAQHPSGRPCSSIQAGG